MPTVTLSRYECTADLVPPVCAACGEPATDRVPHTFSWRPSWRESAGPGDWSGGRSATVRLPLCADHAQDHRRKNRFVAISLLPVLGLMAVALGPVIGFLPGLERVEGLVTSTAAMVLVLAWALALHWFFSDRFQAVEITDRFVTLRGVHPQFVGALVGGVAPGRARGSAAAGAEVGAPSAGSTEAILTEEEYQADLLPPVCARCGAPAHQRVARRVRMLPSRLGCLWMIPMLAGVVFCPPLFVLLLVTVGKRVDVRVPMCPDHEDHWATTDRLGKWLVLPLWSLVAMALTLCALLDEDNRWLYVGGSVLTFLALVVLEKLVARDRVLVLPAEGTDVSLRHIRPAFVTALAERRAALRPERPVPPPRLEDEWDDYDDETMERRGPHRESDWDDEEDDRRHRRRD